MNKIGFNFNYKKTTQALNYLATKQGGKINKMKALKLIYLADRYHLRKYGRLITNDTYFAMDYGPVPSSAKDIAEASDFLSESEQDYSCKYVKPENNLSVKSLDSPDMTMFSETDLEALNFVWKKFGHLNQFDLVEVTHQFPEWTRHKKSLEMDSRVQMDIIDFFEDSKTDFDKLFALSPEEKGCRQEEVKESLLIESLWR
jgi:uncharacterized phage-associated protein